MDRTLYKYCTGCGLCQSIGVAELERDQKGFAHPSNGDESTLKKLCPAYGNQTKIMQESEIWGRALQVSYGWATDMRLRDQASSGGVTTAICWFLLNEGLVDGVIHTCADPDQPTKTKTCISSSYEELALRCGSRYAISSPLDIISQLESDKRYVFVGKPCDVDVLRNYLQIKPELSTMIPYLLSFFCMGLPSDDAQKKLLKSLGCQEEDCVSLRYRGDGWPGLTKAIDKSGKSYTTDYDSSWGKILGRDLMPMCRFCINGIGETADISCGDAWYLGENNKPVFTEAQGRNVVFARTSIGLSLLSEACEKGYLHLETFDDFRKELPLVQYAQYERRGTIGARINALRILCKPRPKYRFKLMMEFKKIIPLSRRFDYFKGTLKRAVNFDLKKT